jgi:hypothetical protein
MERQHQPQQGYGIHLFRAAKEDGTEWQYLFNLPDPAGASSRQDTSGADPSSTAKATWTG